MTTGLSNYFINNDDIFLDSSAYIQGYLPLKDEFSKFNINDHEKLAYHYGFSGEIAILHSVYVKGGDFGIGIGSRYLRNMIQFYEYQNIENIYLVADLTILQEDGINLIKFYQKHGFEILKTDNQSYALMRLHI